jgi:hypothetical protein
MPSATISRLERIQNRDLWDYYCSKRERMAKLAGGPPSEVSVWHGTRTTDPRGIYEDRQDGFMMQFSNGGMWGRGIYFAENASYSNTYSYQAAPLGQARQFMLAKLLSGDEIRMPSNRSLTKCPAKPGGGNPATERYDTVTGHTAGSKVYIVYENGRAYPEYLITYTP